MPSRLLVAAPLALLATASIASAAERVATLDGGRLLIDGPCAQSVTVEPDAGLHNQVVVTARANRPEELERLLMEGGSVARIHTAPPGCWQPALLGLSQRSLRIEIRVPTGYPMVIDESGSGSYALGNVGGTLALDISGFGDVSAQSATDLTVDLSGAGHVHLAGARGPAKISLSGSGDITIGTADMPSLLAEISGAGTVAIEGGAIGHAAIEDSGLGTLRIGAVVGSTKVELSGMGSVHLARVTGAVDKEVSGLGTVTVGP